MSGIQTNGGGTELAGPMWGEGTVSATPLLVIAGLSAIFEFGFFHVHSLHNLKSRIKEVNGNAASNRNSSGSLIIFL